MSVSSVPSPTQNITSVEEALKKSSIQSMPATQKWIDRKAKGNSQKPFAKTRIQNDMKEINQELKSGSVNLMPIAKARRTRNPLDEVPSASRQ
jgi:hypothetical protein